MPDSKKTGSKLKKLRLQSQLSLREFARRIEYSPSYVSHIEKGEKRGSVDFFSKCAEVLGISAGDFFEENKISVPNELKEAGVEWIQLFNEMKHKGITTEQVLEWIEEYRKNGK